MPLRRMYEAAAQSSARRWTEVEASFLEAMWEFDRNVALGVATQGDIQNGKGDFFTDLIALLLENATGRQLYTRRSVPGLFFPQHNLDATYPGEGPIELVIETKVAGAPKSEQNPEQRNPKGRPGSSDLKKRVTEAGLNTLDLKLEVARLAGEGGGPSGDLVDWLQGSKPFVYLFLAVRVVDEGDLRRTIELSDRAKNMMNGVGLVAYEPGGASGYSPCDVPTHLELDRVRHRVATKLRSSASDRRGGGG